MTSPDIPESADARQGIQSVELAMTVLLALEEGRGPMSLTQIAAASGMQPSKAHRYLVSLGRIGLIARSPSSGLYDLGPSMRRLGIESLRRMDEVALVSDHLPSLRDSTGHAINLAVWGDHGPVIVRWDYGSYALPITVRVGATMPLWTSSIGRVYLAHLPATMTQPVLTAQFEAAGTQGRVPTPREIEKVRTQVVRDGFALTSGGVVPGIASVAAPVFSGAESLPLAVALAMPIRQATKDVVDAMATEVYQWAHDMSRRLGYAGL